MSRRSEVFPRVSRFRKGYARRQVDAVLAGIRETLAGSPRLTAGDVRRVGFELVYGGYDVRVVDSALDELEERVLQLATRTLAQVGGPHVAWELDALRRQLSAPPGLRFPRVRGLRWGDDVDEVDRFVTRITNSFREGAPVSTTELRAAGFARQRRGYDRDAVDRTLDRLIELMVVSRDMRPATDIQPTRPAAHRRREGRRT